MDATGFFRLLKARLPFLTGNAETELLTDLRLDVLATLQTCLGKTDEQLENLESYSRLELMLVADLVAIKYLWAYAASKVGEIKDLTSGTTDSGPATYLKRAKAGSAEAEFALVGAATGSLDVSKLLDTLKGAALSQGAKFNCVIDFLLDASQPGDIALPFYFSGTAGGSHCEACGC